MPVQSQITKKIHSCVFCSGATQMPYHATLEKQSSGIPSRPSFFEQPFRLSTFFFKTPNSSVSFRRGRTRIYTLIELLMRKSYKNDVSFRRCQFAPCLIFPFFLQLFKCFSTSSFPVSGSIFLLRKVKIRIFTLIELLIVIAMTAILAGMLLPALNKAREKAQKIKCSSNLKQMGTVITMYIQDNKDFKPCGQRSFSWDHMWYYQIGGYPNENDSYLPNSSKFMYWGAGGQKKFKDSVYQCPSMHRKVELRSSFGMNASHGASQHLKYDFTMPIEGPSKQAKRLSSSWLMGCGVMDYSRYDYAPQFGAVANGTIGMFHDGNKNTNLLYADGRVEACTGLKFLQYKCSYRGWMSRDANVRAFWGFSY